jgi:2'-hydroxyisoflavone reductase
MFVSTCSVYADQSSREGQREDAALAKVVPGVPDYPDNYGANKALCETVVREAFGGRALIARPGMITGPHDQTDRLAYWPRRIARGGTVLAPGAPDDPVQFIDARDLAAWVADGVHYERHGTFNLVGNPMPIGKLLQACKAVTFSDAELTWIPSERLLAAGVSPWMGVPMWIGDPAVSPGINDVGNVLAIDAGLTLRPVAETIRDTLAWDIARGGPRTGGEGLTAEEERRLLAVA